eukprot:GFUD01054200.1.p1 GENE.GFUD01054200.1~~GFUD01054200.1.p1  ORF type:complete len:159 (-),score=40.82 GFUD01054200.1:7-432(-)
MDYQEEVQEDLAHGKPEIPESSQQEIMKHNTTFNTSTTMKCQVEKKVETATLDTKKEKKNYYFDPKKVEKKVQTATLDTKKEEKNYYLNPKIVKGAVSSPKWQCNMCAAIFPSKQETMVHLKDSHQISKSSVYGKRIKQIA